MKNNARKIFTIMLAAVFFISTGVIGFKYIEYNSAQEIYDEAVALAELPEIAVTPEKIAEIVSQASEENEAATAPDTAAEQAPAEEVKPQKDPYADALASMDFQTLKEVNSDVIGWIVVPDTKLSYPLVQGTDNQYYLNHTWKKTKNASGAIFMEHRSNQNLSDFNTIIYGHRMGNSTMFGSLAKYKDLSYWEANPIVNVSNEEGSYSYLIFAAYDTDVTSDTFRIKFENKKEQQDLIDHAVENSVINTGIVPGEGSKILTLSTCIGASVKSDTRWVVQAVRVEL